MFFFGYGTPMLLSKINKTYLFCVEKVYQHELFGMTVQLLPSHPADISWLKLSKFQFSNFSKVDIIIYNPIFDICLTIFAPKFPIKWPVSLPKTSNKIHKISSHRVNSDSMYEALFLPDDVIENGNDFYELCFGAPVKFKLINLDQYMLPIAHRDSTRYGNICHP